MTVEQHKVAEGVVSADSPTTTHSKRNLAHRASDGLGSTVARRPLQAMCACCAIIIIIPVILGLTAGMGMSDEGTKDWEVLSSDEVKDQDAIFLSEEAADCIPDTEGVCPEVSERQNADYSVIGLSLMYTTTDGSEILTAANLQVMCNIERTFTGGSAYPKACPLAEGVGKTVREAGRAFKESDCSTQMFSIVQKIYLEVASSTELFSCSLLDEDDVAAASTTLHDGLADTSTFTAAGFFLGADVVSGTTYKGGKSAYSRSMLGLGYPLYGRTDSTSSDLSTTETTDAYMDMFFDQFLEDFYGHFGYSATDSPMTKEYVIGKVKLYFASRILANEELNNLVNTDLTLALGSIIFTFLYLAYHTESIFVAAVSIWQVCMSLLLAMFVYRIVFNITYFRQLHILLVFVILGIGADNVFVFSDAWKEHAAVSARDPNKKNDEKNLADRIAFAWHHSMSAVFNTTLTTAVAFGASITSPIMPIMTLGYYGALLVICNYALLVSFTPCVFAVHETYNKWTTCPNVFGFCCKRKTTETSPVEPDAENPTSKDSSPSVNDDEHTSKILRKYILPTLSKKPVAVIGVLILVAWGVTNFFFAAQLSSPKETLKMFGDDHMVTLATNLASDGYAAGAGSDYATMKLSFGLSGINRDVEPYVDSWKPHEFYGVPVYDSSFDLTTADAQTFLRNICDELAEKKCTEEACQPYGTLVMPGDGTMSCFINDFYTWTGGVVYEGDEFLQKLEEFRAETTPSATEVGESTWKKSIGFVGGKLHFVIIEAQLTLKAGEADSIKEPVKDLLDAWVDAKVAAAPGGMKSIIHTVPDEWSFLITTKSVLTGMFTGFAICFPVVFVVLLCATGNIRVSFMAVIAIIFVVGNVLGYCWMAGWSLGITESIAAIIVIGLAVDYVIHLGHMYLEAGVRENISERDLRWKYSMRMMGGTVVAGAFTTLGAGLVMQFCQIQFFKQMSTLIIMTIVYSIIYAMIAFMGTLLLIGPEGDQGDIGKFMMALYRRIRGQAKVRTVQC